MLSFVEIARKAILDKNFTNNEFREKRGIFVTIYSDDELRGCIGFIEPIFTLSEGIIKAARLAAFYDNRFLPLGKNEKFKVEISILSNPELIRVKNYKEYLKKIKIGEDGLIIESGNNKGLLLPKVFIEYDVDVKRALEMTCSKAGLDKDEWMNLKNKVYKFQAKVYSE
ncbi:MAG: TIGR00296 family protein [archaeon]